MSVIFKIIVELIVGAGLVGFRSGTFYFRFCCVSSTFKNSFSPHWNDFSRFWHFLSCINRFRYRCFPRKNTNCDWQRRGSNIANIGLILGVVALIVPIEVHSRLVKWELPALIVVSFVIGAFLWNGYLSRPAGIILILLLVLHLYWLWITALKKQVAPLQELPEEKLQMPAKKKRDLVVAWVDVVIHQFRVIG